MLSPASGKSCSVRRQSAVMHGTLTKTCGACQVHARQPETMKVTSAVHLPERLKRGYGIAAAAYSSCPVIGAESYLT